MTAETSNARGEVVAWFPTYASGEIVRNYGDGSPVYACKTKEEAEQAKRCHLGATGPVIPLYAAPPPAAADEAGAFDANFLRSVANLCRAAYDLCQPKPQRTPEDVREHHGELCLSELASIADEIERRLAPPSAPVGVDEAMVERALAAYLRRQEDGESLYGCVTAALTAALDQQPAAVSAETDLPINDAVPAPTKIEPGNLFLWNWRQMQVYAQACVAHATASKDAEIEALRAEVKDYRENGAYAVRFAPNSAHWSAELRRLFGDDARGGIEVLEQWHRDSLALAERLAKALREAADMLLADYPETAKRLRDALAQEDRND